MPTIVTLNLNYDGAKRGAWPARRALVVEALNDAAADAVALQAVVRRHGGADQTAELRDALGWSEGRFVPLEDGADGVRGSALLAPAALSDVCALSMAADVDHPDAAVRAVVHAHVASAGIHLFNAHFSWVGETALAQVGRALPFLAGFAGPALVVGDLNATPDSPVARAFAQAGWIDLWARLRPGDDGFTYESGAPSQRIDYAWANAALAPAVASIARVEGAEAGVRLSDHWGLRVDFAHRV
jgi:endonuclease/exonuclease/phosphatase family metal-dependent hydrolase